MGPSEVGDGILPYVLPVGLSGSSCRRSGMVILSLFSVGAGRRRVVICVFTLARYAGWRCVKMSRQSPEIGRAHV